jgi:hypothetical protein
MKYYGRCLTTYSVPGYSNGRRKCTGRRMLSMLPAEYLRPPKCPHCGGTRWYIDTHTRKRHIRENCACGGLHYVHRRGTRYCYSHPDVEADHSGRYGIDTSVSIGLVSAIKE